MPRIHTCHLSVFNNLTGVTPPPMGKWLECSSYQCLWMLFNVSKRVTTIFANACVGQGGVLPIISWPDAPQSGRNTTVGREQDNTTTHLKNNGGFYSSAPLFLLPHLFLYHPSQSNSWILKWGHHMCLQPDLHEALFYSSQLVAGAKTEGTTDCVWNHLLT